MDFDYTPEQEQIRSMVREFAEKEIRPGAMERDRSGEFDWTLLKKMGDLGVTGLLYPEEYGGAHADTLSYCLAVEESARVDYSFSFELGGIMHPLILYKMSNDEQRKRWRSWFEGGARGELVGSLAVTEPEAGSNIAAIQTTAVLDGDEWVLNGTKAFVTHVGCETCAYVLVLGVTNREKNEYNFIVVPRGTPGLKVTRRYSLIGIKSVWNGELVLEDCRVPAENQVWKRGQGRSGGQEFFQIMTPIRFSGEIGLQQACFDEALRYAKQRKAFNRPISKFQHVQEMLVEMERNLEISRLLRDKAVTNRDKGKDSPLARSRFKWFVSEAAVTASKYAIQILGGVGLTEDTPLAKYYRDARISTIPGGTSEVHKANIARYLGC